jgi:hypothetical protein
VTDINSSMHSWGDWAAAVVLLVLLLVVGCNWAM